MGIQMTDTPRPRGRPKGSGIDDRESLRAIVALLSRDSNLKPTTAIRQSGVTDPSVVRRLREKLKLATASLVESKSGSPPKRPGRSNAQKRQASPPEEKSAGRDARGSRTPAAESPAQPDTLDTPSPLHGTTTDTSPSAGTPSTPDQTPRQTTPLTDPQLEALRLSAEAAAAVSRLYLHCMNYAAQTNPMSLALRSQTVVSQWIAGLLSGSMPAPSGGEK